MAQQTLQTAIVLSGSVENSFSKIGVQLQALGMELERVSGRVREFGTEAINKYMNYDDLMRQVQAVGEFSSSSMGALRQINKELAQSTIYTVEQLADAELIMGQYGLTLQQIKDLLPDVLELSMAGGIDVNNAIDYLYSTLMSMGEGIEYADTLVDQMAKTAAIGATDIDTLGESVMRMGSAITMFRGGSVEFLSILSAMSQFGQDQRGAQAGTWLRNFMLSLAAPTSDIDAMKDALMELGWAEEDVIEAIGNKTDGTATTYLEALQTKGLKIFDEAGNLLPAIDIIKSLRDAVKGDFAGDLDAITDAVENSGKAMGEFLDDVQGELSDNSLYTMLRTIFGRRGVSTAMNLISITDEEWADITGKVMNSDGFAKAMGETMQGGIGGAMRSFTAAWDELQVTMGEAFSPIVMKASEWLQGIVTSFSNMPIEHMTALTNMLGVIGAAGPAMIGLGGLFRLMGALATPAGGIALGVTAVAALVSYLSSLENMSLRGHFGEMALDMETMTNSVEALNMEFMSGFKDIREFRSRMEDVELAYRNAASTLSSKLLTNAIAGAKLTDGDKQQMLALGEEMGNKLQEGIFLKGELSASFWKILFGEGKTDAELAADENYQAVIDAASDSFRVGMERAEELGQQFRDALTAALEDSNINDEERRRIQGLVNAYNDEFANATLRAKEKEEYVNMQMLLHNAQTASFDSLTEYADKLTGGRAEVLATTEEEYLRNRYALAYEMEQGTLDRAKGEAALAAADNAYYKRWANISSRYDESLLSLWMGGIESGGGDLLDAWNKSNMLATMLRAGKINGAMANSMYAEQVESNAFNTLIGTIIEDLGGSSALEEKIKIYRNAGMNTLALQFENLLLSDAMRYGMLGDWEGRKAQIQSGLYNAPTSELTFVDIPKPVGAPDYQSIIGQYMQGELNRAQANEMLSMQIDISNADEATSSFLQEAQSALTNNPGIWTVHVRTAPQNTRKSGGGGGSLVAPTVLAYAEGGRADAPSIFGEAGPEWAIPEEHSKRTADLLDAARKASGFTWGELLSRTGGLNAGNNKTVSIVYSPTIMAKDATGVEEKLRADKERLEQWWEDRQRRDRVEVYA